jgi:hypothetical protein
LRCYLSSVIGDGSEDNPFSPAVAEHILNWQAVDGRGNPLSATGVMLVECDPTGAEHSAILADPRCVHLPFEDAVGNPLPLTARLDEVQPVKLRAIKARLEENHVPTLDLLGNNSVADALRTVIQRFMIRQVLGVDDFTEGLELAVGGIPSSKLQRINKRLKEMGFDLSGVTPGNSVRATLQNLLAQKRCKTHMDGV